ncbi:MAG: DNA polymerase III subunit delta' [Thermodesulfobacteriota bacterium]
MTEDAFEILEGQRALDPLTAVLRKETIPHALLFTGMEGIGKRTAALALAMACNCEAPAGPRDSLLSVARCGCRSCRKIRSDHHPDIHRVAPSGAYIKIDQIRRMCRSLALKPYEARIRVAILAGAQHMNPEAANALLKMLEEPPDRTVLILTAVQAADLLPTIVSRCRTVRFSPLPKSRVREILVRRYGLPPEEAASLAELKSGIDISENGMGPKEWARWRAGILRICADLSDPDPPRPPGMLLAFAETLSKHRDILSDSLDIIKTWLRDLMVCRYAPDHLINRDCGPILQNLSRKMTVQSLLSKIDAVGAAQKALVSNANPRLTLEVLVLRLSRSEL